MAPKWRHGVNLEPNMPVSLSIKAVPDALVERLRRRAAGNHRSLQRELMALVEAAVQQPPARGSRSALAADSPQAGALTLSESEAAWQVSADAAADGLLAELDGIVAGSRWGEAPLLTREQVHDRALAREIDFEARQSERAATPQPRRGGAA
jgi:plasmid stability protein